MDSLARPPPEARSLLAGPRSRRSSLPEPASTARPWLASYPPGVPPTYAYPDVPLARFLDDAARDFPNRVGTWTAGARLTWAELRDRADRFAAAAAAVGIGHGDRVALVLPTLPATLIALTGASRLGAAVLPLDPSSGADVLRARLRAAGCRLVVTTDEHLPSVLDPTAGAPAGATVVVTSVEDWLPGRRWLPPRRGRHRTGAGTTSWQRFLDGADRRVPQAAVGSDDVALVHAVRTGEAGTSALVVPVAAAVAAAFQARLWIPDVRAGADRLLVAPPPGGVAGSTPVLLMGVLSAATLVLVPRPDDLVSAAERARPTLLGTDAAGLAGPVGDAVAAGVLRSVRVGLCTGGSVGVELVERFEAQTGGGRLRAAHAPPEAGAVTHANPVYGRSRPGTVGLPLPDTAALVVDPDDPERSLPAGAIGRLAVSGPQVVRGYLGDPERTGQVLRDGWCLTGDLARVDADGFCTIEGRLDDLPTGEAREDVA